MNNVCKRIAAVVVAISTLLTLSTAFAAQPIVNHPNWTYITKAQASIYIDDGEVMASALLKGTNNVTRCQITLYIQKSLGGDWVTVVSDSDSDYSNSLNLELSTGEEYEAVYRVKASFKVWVGTTTESTTIISYP